MQIFAASTLVVLLGTGNPGPTPERSGPATAIVVNDIAYLVDFGPGVVRRASASRSTTRSIAALQPSNLRVAFDNSLALRSHRRVPRPDLHAMDARPRACPARGLWPQGSQSDDRAPARGLPSGHRNAHQSGRESAKRSADGHKSERTRNRRRTAYTRTQNVTVTAFATKHAMESYGYRFDTADRSIVISGDTNPTQATIDACRGCDVHHSRSSHPATWLDDAARSRRRAAGTSVGSRSGPTPRRRNWPIWRKTSEAATTDSVSLQQHCQPEELFGDMASRYAGQFVVGRDLDVY